MTKRLWIRASLLVPDDFEEVAMLYGELAPIIKSLQAVPGIEVTIEDTTERAPVTRTRRKKGAPPMTAVAA